MQYRLKKYSGETYLFYSKKELFKQFDIFARCDWKKSKLFRSNLRNIITNEFIYGSSEKYIISEKIKTYPEVPCYKEYYYVKINALYVVIDCFGNKMDVDILIQDYSKSRNLDRKKKSKYLNTNFYSKKRRNLSKKSIYFGTKKTRGMNKEYKDSFISDEFDVKIRRKRYSEAKLYHCCFYDSFDYPRDNTRSWKKYRKFQYK